jgi:hypothetical protein
MPNEPRTAETPIPASIAAELGVAERVMLFVSRQTPIG